MANTDYFLIEFHRPIASPLTENGIVFNLLIAQILTISTHFFHHKFLSFLMLYEQFDTILTANRSNCNCLMGVMCAQNFASLMRRCLREKICVNGFFRLQIIFPRDIRFGSFLWCFETIFVVLRSS